MNRKDSFARVIKEVEDFLDGANQSEKQPESLDDMAYSVKNLSEYELPLDEAEDRQAVEMI